MYDFCFTPFYAIVLVIGGLISYVSAGSLPSGFGGVGSGLVLLLLTYWSFATFKASRRKALGAVVGSLAIAAGLAFMMGKRFMVTGGGVPGFIAGTSVLMCVYYVYNLACIPTVAPAAPHGHAKAGDSGAGERPAAKRGGKLRHA